MQPLFQRACACNWLLCAIWVSRSPQTAVFACLNCFSPHGLGTCCLALALLPPSSPNTASTAPRSTAHGHENCCSSQTSCRVTSRCCAGSHRRHHHQRHKKKIESTPPRHLAKRCQNVAHEGGLCCIPKTHKRGFPPLRYCYQNFDRFSGYPQMVLQHTLCIRENFINCMPQYAIHHMEHTTCHTQHTIHVMENTTCNTQLAAWKKQHTRMCHYCTPRNKGELQRPCAGGG